MHVFFLLLFGVIICVKGTKNIVYIMFDDLRPELSIYGQHHMITPNFERLASKSMVFNHAHCQVSVCNPSRDSLMTGLRPDTTKSYSFDKTFKPHMSFPLELARNGYEIIDVGKIFHGHDFEEIQKSNISYGIKKSDWYNYQNAEGEKLNATVNPDNVTPENRFRDAISTTVAIKALKKLMHSDTNFLLAIGYKLPHTILHFPHRYYDLYRNTSHIWRDVNISALTFPKSVSTIAYRCCAFDTYSYLNHEGADKATREHHFYEKKFNDPVPTDIYTEMMWAYSASISFVDAQLGRLLDAIDRYQLWNNITIVLTADHGMQNGEKGIWEKWNLFEETTHVPLIIYHPDSPLKGQRYDRPVELIDVYPTLLEFASLHHADSSNCPVDIYCVPLQGTSLASVVLGNKDIVPNMPSIDKNFSLTQQLRCADRSKLRSIKHHRAALASSNNPTSSDKEETIAKIISLRQGLWESCEWRHKDTEVSLMGYSMRFVNYRYTAYIPYNRVRHEVEVPFMVKPIIEELYSHNTTVYSVYQELDNLANNPMYQRLTEMFYKQLLLHLECQLNYLNETYYPLTKREY